jgi:hypothetical protein
LKLKTLIGATVFTATLTLCGIDPAFAVGFNNEGVQYSSPAETARTAPARYNTATYNARYKKPQRTPLQTPITSSFNNRNGAALTTIDDTRQRPRRCNIIEDVGFDNRDIATC